MVCHLRLSTQHGCAARTAWMRADAGRAHAADPVIAPRAWRDARSCSFTAGSGAPLAGLQDSRGPPRHASRVRGPRGSSDQGGVPRPHPASASGRSLQRRSLDDKIPRPALAAQTSRQRSSAPGARPRTSAGTAPGCLVVSCDEPRRNSVAMWCVYAWAVGVPVATSKCGDAPRQLSSSCG